jgi:hypothetical protein
MKSMCEINSNTGKNKLIFLGLLWLGEDLSSFVLTFSGIFFLGILILNYQNFFFNYEKKYNYDIKLYYLDIVLPIVIFYIFNIFFEDPGIIPKNKNHFKKKKQDYTHFNPKYKQSIINGCNFQFKYCETCGIWRPPRTSHCSSCNNCIFKFDHHCPWIGTCVGLRNYKPFLLFIVGLMWYLIFCFHQIFHLIFFLKSSEGKILNYCQDLRNFLTICKIIFILLVNSSTLIFSTALVLLHFYLIFIGKTTSELFKTWEKNFWSYNYRKEIILKFFDPKKISIISTLTKKKKKFLIN